MDEKQKIELLFDVVAVVPGFYRGRASSAFLYYTPGMKTFYFLVFLLIFRAKILE